MYSRLTEQPRQQSHDFLRPAVGLPAEAGEQLFQTWVCGLVRRPLVVETVTGFLVVAAPQGLRQPRPLQMFH